MRFCWFFMLAAVTCGLVATFQTSSARQFTANGDFELRVAEWRRQGPAGLDSLIAQQDAAIQASRRSNQAATKEQSSEVADRERLIDAVSGQIHGSVSRLFWYTDFDQAIQAAEQSGRPILSLRMLGSLNQEVSCANSRFFRTILYANREISDFLRKNYVLHWESVRPVPVATIDFGGGRKIVTTVTGNSFHYVLDSSGRPLDAIPGLYSPADFLEQLQLDAQLFQEVKDRAGAARIESLRQHHQNRLTQMQAAFQKLAESVFGKTGVIPQLEAVNTLEPIQWMQLVGQKSSQTELDSSSESVVNSLIAKTPMALKAGRLASTKYTTEAILVQRFAQSFRMAIAEDSLRNELVFHRQIHTWFLADTQPELATMTPRIYQELFLTPLDDPWMGLVDSQAFSGLRDNGMIVEKIEPTEIAEN